MSTRDKNSSSGVSQAPPQACSQERFERMESAIRWALGEEGTFGEEPEPIAGKWRRRFWWRQELRERAFGSTGVSSVPAAPPQAWQGKDTK